MNNETYGLLRSLNDLDLQKSYLESDLKIAIETNNIDECRIILHVLADLELERIKLGGRS